MTDPLNVPEALDDEVQCALVVAHASEQEDHLWDEIAGVTDLVGLK